MKKGVWILVLICTLSIAYAQDTEVRNYVQDNADIFTPDQEGQLNQALQAFEKNTAVQYVIFTTDAIPEDSSVEEFSLQIAEENKIGQEGNDNGLLFLIAINDRKYRWETGYGIEDILNTAYLGRVSRDNMVPYFQQGRYGDGILAGSEVVMQKIAGSDDEDVFPKELRPKRSNTALVYWLLILVFIVIMSSFGRKRKGIHDDGMLPAYVYMGAASGMFRRGGGFGGFGGFSGGGGSFGGGGFSGGW